MNDEFLHVLDEDARRTDTEGIWPERSITTLADCGLLGLTLPSDSGPAADMRQFAEVQNRSRRIARRQR